MVKLLQAYAQYIQLLYCQWQMKTMSIVDYNMYYLSMYVILVFIQLLRWTFKSWELTEGGCKPIQHHRNFMNFIESVWILDSRFFFLYIRFGFVTFYVVCESIHTSFTYWKMDANTCDPIVKGRFIDKLHNTYVWTANGKMSQNNGKFDSR